jgi:hypothetical protein
VAAVQHTFAHEQYTEYRERNIHKNPIKMSGNTAVIDGPFVVNDRGTIRKGINI